MLDADAAMYGTTNMKDFVSSPQKMWFINSLLDATATAYNSNRGCGKCFQAASLSVTERGEAIREGTRDDC